jgi:sulfide:quinone oxidoreductase
MIREYEGKPAKGKAFEEITPLCVMDAGDMEVIILGTSMYPPRAAGVMIPNPFGDIAKRIFEKYFMWKMESGKVYLP